VTGHTLSRDTIMVSASLVSSTLIYEVIINVSLFFIYFSRNKTLQNEEKHRGHHTVDHSIAVANFQSRGSPFLQGDNWNFFNILRIQGNISWWKSINSIFEADRSENGLFRGVPCIERGMNIICFSMKITPLAVYISLITEYRIPRAQPLFWSWKIVTWIEGCGVGRQVSRTFYGRVAATCLVGGWLIAACILRCCITASCYKNMDKASQVLARGVPPSVPNSYRALADHGGVPRSTLNYRARGRGSIEAKAQSQQYLKP
jgi:hypothetical protein